MLLSDDPFAIAYIVLKALLAIGLWVAAAIGHLFTPLSWWERLLSAAAAFFLVAAIPVTDETGFALAALGLGIH